MLAALLIAQSLFIAPEIQTTLTVTTKVIRLVVDVTGPGGIRDYVGIYPAGAQQYTDWQYVAGKTAHLVFTPSLTTGNYEARLMACNIPKPQPCPINKLASQPFRVGLDYQLEANGVNTVRKAINEPTDLVLTTNGKATNVTVNKDLSLKVLP